ncbi:MAG: HAD-IB family hydrolase [Acidimicrobiia bacterium]
MTAAAFFDLDKTIIAKSSTLAFTKPLYKAGFLSRRALGKAAVAQAYYQSFGADHDQLDRVKDELAAMTKGWSRQEVVSLVEEAVDKVVAPLAYAEALALIDGHRRAGRRVVVISASPEEIVRPLCRYLGIHDVIATRSEIGADGRYTGKIELYAYGPAKAEAMVEMARSQGIDLTDSYAYSDSVTDVPMLEAVGHPVVVNPDADLEEIAIEREWEIRRFESAVTFRDRMPTKTVSGAAVAGGVAAVTYWAIKARKKKA